jgi:CBS domain-containing protein
LALPHGAVIGVISEADFLVKEQGPEPRRLLAWLTQPRASAEARAAKLEAVTAGEAMTTPPVTIGPLATVAEAASVMTRRRVSRLPVVENGHLVGIVTRADLVRAYVRSDAELARSIREEVILHMLCLDPSLFTVYVTDGVARIGGHVERRSVAELLERAVAMVPGIVRVDATLTWTLDDDEIRPPAPDPVFPFGSR